MHLQVIRGADLTLSPRVSLLFEPRRIGGDTQTHGARSAPASRAAAGVLRRGPGFDVHRGGVVAAIAGLVGRCCTLAAMTDPPEPSITDRLARQGEEALGRLAEELIANPVVNGAVTRALEAREKAVQAQEAAMGALNIPSAADIERLTRRLRSVSQRLEGIEDSLDRIEERAAAAGDAADARPDRAVERRLDEMARDVAALREAIAPAGDPVPRAQERLTVTDSA